MPQTAQIYPLVWNKACDIYVTRFLADVGFGKSIFADPASAYSIKLNDEVKIYEYLLERYQLKAEECFFLDDRADNIEAAKAVGMEGMVFQGDYEAVKGVL